MDLLNFNCPEMQVDKLLPTYLDLYDVVLTGDADFSLINRMLQFILQTSS